MKIDSTPTCHITDCLNEAAKFLGLTYEQVETMAFDENIYPEGYETYVNVDGVDFTPKPLVKAIRELMRKDGIKAMYLTEND